MKWSDDAEEAIRKVPFFVRKKVRSRVEKEAAEAGKSAVSLADVKSTQQRYLSGMASEIRGYRIETCFGSGGCPNSIGDSGFLVRQIEAVFEQADILGFLKSQVKDGLKFHHEFSVAIADCPNACSQPQIRDIGIIAALKPALTDEKCSQCGICIETCKENAIGLNSDVPEIDFSRCLFCGQCIRFCPSGTIAEGEKGFRMQLGGKLGRHPRLGTELPGIFSADEVIDILTACIRFYKAHSKNGARFASVFHNTDFEEFVN
jgi:dissimilatory sulfite reductase (desulfoviridin) alpha/beta subunit